MKSCLIRGCLLLVLLCVLLPQETRGEGSEITNLSGEDLLINIDTRWAGGLQGGYYPVRIQVTNRGLAREFTFKLTFQGDEFEVLQTKQLDQNSTSQFTMLVPLVTAGDVSGTFEVLYDDKEIQSLTKGVPLPAMGGETLDRPALLVISRNFVDLKQFEDGVNTQIISPPSSTKHYYGGGYRTSNSQVIPPINLPDQWLAYSCLDFVAIPLDVFAALSEPNRQAILRWVSCGGNLIITETGKAPANSEALDRMLLLDQAASSPESWQETDPSQRAILPLRDPNQQDHRHGAPMMRDEQGNLIAIPEELLQQSQDVDIVWPAREDYLTYRDWLLGRVYVFQNNPFPGSRHDWAWFLQLAGPQQFQWTKRHGMSARQTDDEFLNFLNPDVKGVPVYSFLFLITIFTIAIGPLNYFILTKKKRLYLLIVTIPLIAFITSLSLFAYSMVAHGFSVKSRTRSFTVIDQGSRTSVSTSRVSLYAGLAPGDGLNFSPETAYYPIWAEGQKMESGEIDWTENQQLASGWIRSRTRTQFLLVQPKAERGRLNISASSEDELQVENGLEWDLETLVVVDENGRLWYGSRLEADGSATLSPASQAELRTFVTQLQENVPEPPPGGVTTGYGEGLFSPSRGIHYYMGYPREELRTSFAEGKLEQGYEMAQKVVSEPETLPRRTYWALLKENPNIDLGVKSTKPKGDIHLLLGYY